jgi:RNA polymerase sigma factor (sigma-70 family)
MHDSRDDGVVSLTQHFETYRPRLRAVAYRMLGSLTEADDAVQECWLRLRRADAQEVGNLGGWLTTVVARICLDALRARRLRREEPLDMRLPEPVVSGDALDPEQEALLADAVGLALLVVLDTLAPAERLAFVLHDMFDVPFDEIAAVLGRSAPATRQLASRARRRVQNAAPAPDPDLNRQRRVVEAFLAAARSGDFDALVGLLDPEIVLHADTPGGSKILRGAIDVARGAMAYSARAAFARRALINGTAGLVAVAHGRPIAVMAFSVVDGTIATLDIIADPDRLARLDPAVVASSAGG